MSDFEKFVLELEPANLAKTARFLPRDAVRVLQLFDGKRRLADVVEKSPLDVFKTLAVVKRGAELGLLSLGEKCTPSNPARFLSPATRCWLQNSRNGISRWETEKSPKDFEPNCHTTPENRGAHKWEEQQDEEEIELERELDRVLSELDRECSAEEESKHPVLLHSLPDALEKTLQTTLEQYLDETKREPSVKILLAHDHDHDEDILQKEEAGFTEMEAAFFDSYELDDEEEDDCENLWVLGDESGSSELSALTAPTTRP